MGTITGLIMTISLQMGFDPNMAIAIAQYESSLNPKAVGAIGEVGLFQLRPEFYAESCKGQGKAYVKMTQSKDLDIYEVITLSYKFKSSDLVVKKVKSLKCGRELFDPETNIRIAIAHLIKTQKKFSHYGKFGFLVAYNVGYTNALKIKQPSKFKYAVKVAANYQKLASKRMIASVD